MPRTIIDVTLPIAAGLPVWPGDPPVEIVRGGESPSVSRLSLSSHTGTHVDPPAHFVAGGTPVDALALAVLIGPAWLAHIAGPTPITAGALAAAAIPAGTTRLLLRTANSDAPRADFTPDFVALAPDAAAWLLVHDVQLVGIDGPSIEPFDSPGEPVHHALLAAGVIIVEGLALTNVTPGAYELICLPLRLADADGAPARVVLVREA